MELISRLAIFVGGLVTSALSRLFADEFKAWNPRIILFLVRTAASRLPPGERDRYEEEWQNHLEDVPGELGKLVTAVSFQVASLGIVSEYQKLKKAEGRCLRAVNSLRSRTRMTENESYLLWFLRLPYASAMGLVVNQGLFWYLSTVASSLMRRHWCRRCCKCVIEYAGMCLAHRDPVEAYRLLNAAKKAMDADGAIAPDLELYRAYSEAEVTLESAWPSYSTRPA